MHPPIIFLSGLLCDQTMWKSQQAFFSKDYSTTAFAFPEMDSLEMMAKKVIAQLQEPSIIIGHSMGARVALEVMRQAPDLVKKIALLDFGIHPVKAAEPENRYALIQSTEQHGMDYLIDHWLKPMVYENNRDHPQLFNPMKEMVLNQTLSSFKQQIHALLTRPAVEQVFRSIQIPLYLGVGRQDQWSTLEQHQQMCELNPNAQLDIYESSGHMSPVEAADQVNASLKHWLEQDE
ncbi:TPA: alpha/beta hydrolase [Acinetobacter baumannii]|uniref:Alpha/beta hydrolase n=2 Tax=Acinetobacter TaxID=469 RepID=A0A3A8EBA5_9GAMM|nr:MULTISPECIES: alpha/beta hydrolase [Acinetobacter]OUT25305.1 hydrolase [Acinetobacter nosocomialis P020]MCZ2961613.1 alpha/beta hydrolase [Acinetobacter baumannii]MDR9527340.1 alpha/beta hydrolase [Acinetobacter baumannii]PSE12598.1 alpha/beta hydrolase [Acinetobacter nosocomialis]PUU99284.1 alpha/beta hydrolase [Acinetobacter baumannii]